MPKTNTNKAPNHLGIIMDGNRRWAKGRGLNTSKGHEAGAETLRQIIHYTFGKGVNYLTVFAFSTENWQRTKEEVGFLMKLVMRSFSKYLDEFDAAGVKIVMLGDRQGLSKAVLKTVLETERITKDNTKATLCICFNYGGQQEITEAVRRVVAKNVKAEDITEQMVADNLYHPEIPPIDIIVRTSGEQRLSNFMLWRAAYSELMFVNKHWPDFKETDIDNIIAEFTKRQRRFGV